MMQWLESSSRSLKVITQLSDSSDTQLFKKSHLADTLVTVKIVNDYLCVTKATYYRYSLSYCFAKVLFPQIRSP